MRRDVLSKERQTFVKDVAQQQQFVIAPLRNVSFPGWRHFRQVVPPEKLVVNVRGPLSIRVETVVDRGRDIAKEIPSGEKAIAVDLFGE